MPSRTLVTLSLMITASLAAKAQHVYSIRADSVRIYYVCTRIAIAGQDTLDLSQMSGIGGIDTIYRAGDSIRYVKKGVAKALYAPVTTGLESVLTAGSQALRNIILGNSTSETQYFYQVNRLVRGSPYTGYMFIGDNSSRTGTSIVSRGAVPEQNKLLILDNGANEPWYSPNNAAQYYRMWHEGNMTLAALGGAPATGAASYIHNQISTAQAANGMKQDLEIINRTCK